MGNRYLTSEEQNNLVYNSLSGNERATMELIDFCYPIIGSIAKKYLVYNVDYEDLLQEGVCGVLYSIPRFRPDKGAKFSTYCTFWIIKFIQKFIETNFIKIPDAKLSDVKTYSNFIKEYETINGEQPSEDEIICNTGLTSDEIKNINNLPFSFLASDSAPMILQSAGVETADIAILNVLLEEALSVLTEKEQYVVVHHWGLMSHSQKTLKSIGADMGYSKEGARGIEVRALKKIKKYLEGIEINSID